MKQISENEIDSFCYHDATLNSVTVKDNVMIWEANGITLKKDEKAICDKKMTLYFYDFQMISAVEYGVSQSGESQVYAVECEKLLDTLKASDYTVLLFGGFDNDSAYTFDLAVHNIRFYNIVLKYSRFVAEWN